MNTNLAEAEQRAWNYWFQDGLPTLLSGVGCLCLGAYLLFARHEMAVRHPWFIGFLIVLLAFYVYITLRSRQILDWLKARITYPRTGFASAPFFIEDNASAETAMPINLNVLSWQGADARRLEDIERLHSYRKLRTGFMLALVALSAAAMLFIKSPWICLTAGAAFGLALWIGSRKDQRISWLLLGGFPCLGAYLFIFRIGPRERLGNFLVGAGLLFVLEGGFALLRYLYRNPLPKT